MTQTRLVDQEQALQIVEELIEVGLTVDDGGPSRVLCLAGPPRSGKTTVASQALLLALRAYGDGAARLVVSGRHAADQLSRHIITQMGSLGQTRPVGTLQAFAFQLLTAACQLKNGQALPKLLNGAEQDALLRTVVARHVAHVRSGDDCVSCRLLERYFASEVNWSGVVTKTPIGARELSDHIDDSFIAQLRDMIARMTELGLDTLGQDEVLEALAQQKLDLDARDRLNVQWRLAFALWKEYLDEIESTYTGEYRLDSSQLLIASQEAVVHAEGLALPRMLVVDDWQDLTIAGMGFVQALWEHGVRLVLVGNNDESVQAFRGSYPEFLSRRIRQLVHQDDYIAERSLLPADFGRLGAVCLQLPYRPITQVEQDAHNSFTSAVEKRMSSTRPASFADLLTARISLSILDEEENADPLFDRPGKMPHWEYSAPITPLDSGSALCSDGSVTARLFQQPDQEEADVVWQIKHEFLAGHWDWNDMAVIAHDNATVRSIGQKLRVEGVPVRYSSIAQPLKDVPTVQGLFALIHLAQARSQNLYASQYQQAKEQAQSLASHFRTLLSSPLMQAQLPDRQTTRPVRVGHLDTLLAVVVSLTHIEQVQVSDADGGADVTSAAAIRQVSAQWKRYVQERENMRNQLQAQTGVSVDDSLMDGIASPAPGSMQLGLDSLSVDALYTLLLFDGVPESQEGDLPARAGESGLRQSVMKVLQAIADSHQTDPDLKALEHCLYIVDKTARGLDSLDHDEPEYVLWQAWEATGLADQWQTESLEASLAGEQANDRLDAMMRLFQFATSSQVFASINDFMSQVEGMQIEADSLAHVGPVEHAVTLTTPAGAAALAQTWPVVWLPSLQEGVWPNLVPRDMLFGAEDLANVILYGSIRQVEPGQRAHNSRLKNTLYAEEKGFLIAVSRAERELKVSAVWNDSTVPSDFLYGFLPEFFPRVSDVSQAHFTQVGERDDSTNLFSGLEVGERGLVAAARSILVRHSIQESDGVRNNHELPVGGQYISAETADDAAATLRLLAHKGLREANPANWPFVYSSQEAQFQVSQPSSTLTKRTSVQHVTLSPSAVDNIWSCPLEWVMGNRFSGPGASSVAMSFGSLIHQVAEQASKDGLDRPGRLDLGKDDVGSQKLIEDTTDSMMEIYRDLLERFPTFSHPKDAYEVRRRDSRARSVLGNIASYFVKSAQEGYASGGKTPVVVGTLLDAQQEEQFTASFTPGDFTAIWNATYPEHALEEEEFFALISALSGGFPQSLSLDTNITLSGRIDRLEHREIDGMRVNRLVDYKTGNTKHTGPQVFSDLQLVCYQLGLAFTSEQASGASASTAMSSLEQADPVSQAVLFDVSMCPAPAWSRTAETVYQPALFREGRFNTVFEPRFYQGKLSKLAKLDPLSVRTPNGVRQQTWDFVRQVQSTDQGIWALTMVARVCFAAGVKLSTQLQDVMFDSVHCHKKKKNGNCQAWEFVAGTVMEDQR